MRIEKCFYLLLPVRKVQFFYHLFPNIFLTLWILFSSFWVYWLTRHLIRTFLKLESLGNKVSNEDDYFLLQRLIPTLSSFCTRYLVLLQVLEQTLRQLLRECVLRIEIFVQNEMNIIIRNRSSIFSAVLLLYSTLSRAFLRLRWHNTWKVFGRLNVHELSRATYKSFRGVKTTFTIHYNTTGILFYSNE